MQKLKKLIAILICAVLVLAFTGCTEERPGQDSGKLKIVCTLFPQYDFAKNIFGDSAEITLLLTPGTDSHSYDPSPIDMVKINECDLFIYTGELMEAWAAAVIENLPESVRVLDVSKGLELSAVESGEHAGEEHEHSYDPHVWTSPLNAVEIVRQIAENAAEIDPKNASEYAAAADSYVDSLMALDGEISAAIEAAEIKKIIVCDRFSMYYFCERYGLDYIAAFDSCTSNTEPSPAVIVEITKAVETEKIPAVFAAELSNRKVADAVAEQTGAQVLELHSCHNLSAADFEAGESYLSLMYRNLENLKIALG